MRLFKPMEKWDPDLFMKRLAKDREGMSVEELRGTIAWMAKSGPRSMAQQLGMWVWPKQLPQAMRWAARLAKK